jgi:hypothetical protein
MIDDALVLDAVVRGVNATKENVAPPLQRMAEPLLEAVYGLHAMLSPESHRLPPEEVHARGPARSSRRSSSVRATSTSATTTRCRSTTSSSTASCGSRRVSR